MDDAGAPIMRLMGLTRRYGKGESQLEVLSNISLDLFPGELVGLLGQSGAGKSTLLHIAGLLERPDLGEVEISGHPTTEISDKVRTAHRRSKIGFVYQFHHLLPEFSALENIMMPQMIAGKSKRDAAKRASYLLEQMELGPRAKHRPAELSGGEQQRVAIARALANRPQILLADEPTGDLDPRTGKLVFQQLLNLVRNEQVAGLIATHNHALTDAMDRVLVLEPGRLAEYDAQAI